MTDSTASDPVRVSTIPDPTIVDPSTVNGQCDPTDQQPPIINSHPKFKMDQEMKISDNMEGQGRPISMTNQTKIEYAHYLHLD